MTASRDSLNKATFNTKAVERLRKEIKETTNEELLTTKKKELELLNKQEVTEWNDIYSNKGSK